MRKNIDDMRKEIDRLDAELMDVLSKRLSASEEVGKYKKVHNLPTFDQKRWQSIIDNAIKQGTMKNVPTSFTEQLYTLIQNYSQKLQQVPHKKRIIGIQGGPGSFNDIAALTFIKTNNFTNYELKYLYTTEKLLKALNERIIDRAIFSIHNSTAGMIDESVQAVSKYPFSFVGSAKLPIAHTLMMRKDAKLSDVTTIMSHPQAQIQSKKNLAKKYPHLKLTSGEGDLLDQSLVAKHMSEGKLGKEIATIGSSRLAEIYDLQIIEENIHDNPDNFSTFMIVEPIEDTV